MGQHHCDQQPEAVFVDGMGHRDNLRVGAAQLGYVNQPEPAERAQATGRVVQPARQRNGEHQHIQQHVGCTGDALLPAGHTRHRLGHAGIKAPAEAEQHQRQHGDADGLVRGVDPEILGRLGQFTHGKADHAQGEDQQCDQPMQDLADTPPGGGRVLGGHERSSSGPSWGRSAGREREFPGRRCGREWPQPRSSAVRHHR
ncbi:hypothetical protein G6F61_013943 [Rhizopus arrhizus]|nr:hypothetical protein G6F61_013943 [Rhizopus arrhizus]